MISTHGVETTAGSRILEGYVPVFDATVAARVKAAGLPLLGKTNTDEFGDGLVDREQRMGTVPQPVDPDRVPGGSGGGSAAAVSAGLAPWALGSDTGGSIKQPSALCGKRRPAADLRDGVAVRRRRVRVEPRSDRPGGEDRARLRPAVLDHRRSRPARLDDRGVARSGAAGRRGPQRAARRRPASERAPGIEPGVREAVAAAIALAEELGAEVGECEPPRSVKYGLPCYYLIAPAEASSNLARYDGVRHGPRVDAPSFHEMVERTRDEGFGDEPKRRIMLGTYALSAGYYDAYYGQAQRVRTLIVQEHRAAFERFDLLVSPTSPTVAFLIGERAADLLAMYAADLLTIPSCLAGLPGLNVSLRAVRGAAGRSTADRAAVRREHAVPCRACAGARARLRRGAGPASRGGDGAPWRRPGSR